MPIEFTGFPPEGLRFLADLATHNNREWFLPRKELYEESVRQPMEALVAELQPRYGAGKVSRIYRDTRFSRDKSPYKTNISAGIGGRYVSLSASGIWAGAGLYAPDAPRLTRYRDAVADGRAGRRLETIVASLKRRKYEIGAHESLSTAPRGYPPDHPRIDLLKMKGLYAGRTFPAGAWLSTRKARERIERVIVDTTDLVEWMRKHVGPMHE